MFSRVVAPVWPLYLPPPKHLAHTARRKDSQGSGQVQRFGFQEAGAPALSKTRNRGLRHRKKVLDAQAVCSYKKEACLRHQTNVLDADCESKTSRMGLRHRINNGSRARGFSRVCRTAIKLGNH